MAHHVIDAVLSYHTNPLTCGVAKFNQQLAEKLGVPCLKIDKHPVAHPIVSVKSAENQDWPLQASWYRTYSVFLHDEPHGLCTWDVLRRARVVYAATPAIAEFVRVSCGVTAIETGCPSTLQGNHTRGTLNILSYGMAHKLQVDRFRQLKGLLERTDPHYTISISTAIHEGSPWGETFERSIACLRSIFGDQLRVLGFLGDDALAKELRECQAAALFYDPAVRANNTTLWAALDAGTPVITNLDADSPKELQHNVSVFDLAQLTEWPDAAACRVVRAGGATASKAYSWEKLIEKLQERATV